jgi:hypothetical protein
MAQPMSKTQLPLPPDDMTVFERGMEQGEKIARRIAAWAEEHPGQLVLLGLCAGFVVGKLLFAGPAKVDED